MNPPALPMVLALLFSTAPPPEAEELELEGVVEPVLPNEAVVAIRRFEAIFRNPGAIDFPGDGGGPPLLVPVRGLRRCGVDFIFAGERGGLSGADKVLGTFRVVTCSELPAADCCCLTV